MITLDRPTCVRNRLSSFQVVHGLSAPAGRCSSALMLRCTLASRGFESFSPQLHTSSYRRRVDGLTAFDKYLPRFQVWHHSEMSTEWVHLVRSLPCPLRTTCHRSPNVWWRDSGKYGHNVGVRWLQTACDHSTGFIQCRVQFFLRGLTVPTPGKRTMQLSSIALERTT